MTASLFRILQVSVSKGKESPSELDHPLMHSLVWPEGSFLYLQRNDRIKLHFWLQLPLARQNGPRMKILTFTTLFPNRKRPDFGIFIFQRMSHVSERPKNLVQVLAPVPFFPSWIGSKRWGIYSQIPRKENAGNLSVYHPRYPLL